MSNLQVIARDQATPESQKIFDQLSLKMGRVPNLYAAIGNSHVALAGILSLSENLANGTLSPKEIEAVALAVGQTNQCDYCLSAHTALAKMRGFSERETLELRDGTIEDPKLSALVALAAEITETRGWPNQMLIEKFFGMGYSQSTLAEVIGLVALNTFTNYINHIAATPIDFPKAPELERVSA